MNKGKEIFTKAGSHVFRAIADILDAAAVFYKSGNPGEGDKMIVIAQGMIEQIPELA